MSDETTLLEGAGAVVPATDAKAPRSDAEAALQEAEKPAVAESEAKTEEAKPDDEAETRKKNRTREYIARINRENAEMRQRLADAESRAKAPATQTRSDGEPKLEDFDYDLGAFNKAHTEFVIKQHTEQQKQADEGRRQVEVAATYNQKIADFADSHPDFQEVVGSIAYPLSSAVEAAIMAHENGPEIAYLLGTDDDAAFQLAAVQPHLAAAAVQRLSLRLSAAPPAPQPTPTPKPVSKAPTPVPTVSGRAPAETPPEKLTDDQWYAQRRAKQGAK